MRRFLAAFLGMLALNAAGAEQATQWIWISVPPKPEGNETVFFRREFDLPPEVASATISIVCDDIYHLWVNGKDCGSRSEWRSARGVDVTEDLHQGGRNIIAVEGKNEQGLAGLALRFRATLKNGTKLYVTTDDKWQCSHDAFDNWQQADAAPAGWQPATVVGKMGEGPWGVMVIQPESGDGPPPQAVTEGVKLAPGFKLERLYKVPEEQGSWVAMTTDDKGRLWCSDQYGHIYRVTPAVGEDGRTNVELVSQIPLQGAHGLLWFKGALYVCVNEGGDQSGVWRVTDSNGDGEPDKPELLKAFHGRGEHGPHSLVASPDGQWIYVCCGNFTDYPGLESTLPATTWAEDQLLPRRPDAGGHDPDRMAPGGWIARFHPDNTGWELVAMGFRNPFDLGFNDQGDLFTYDSDMEWDFGTPWYRPTRICQVIPGAEFGWRNGTGKWPEYYEDSMFATLNIGPGSPTGVLFGKGAKFPAKYQAAMYALDWTYATISAVHLTPQPNGGYKAEREEFLSGTSLPLTDAVIGADGAMYFATGGRKTASTLWRVSYTGQEPVGPVEFKSKELKLEDRGQAWEKLGSPDRLTRYEARLALEKGDAAEVAKRLEEEKDAWRIIGGVMDLARTASGPTYRELCLKALSRLDWGALDQAQKLNSLRALGLVFIRDGEPSAEERAGILAKLDGAFPSTDDTLNRELCRMLCYLQAPGIVGRALSLMDSAGPGVPPDWLELAKRNPGYGKTLEEMIAHQPPEQVIHYIYCLRAVKGPWSQDERKRFMAWFPRLLQAKGGASYAGFLRDLQKETLAAATPEERTWLEKLEPAAAPNPLANLPQPQGPGREWSIDEVAKLAEGDGLGNRNKDNGHKMFQAALCVACHRFNGEGGSAGPDLSALGGRFQPRDLAEAVLDPSKVVSDQYAFEIITKKDGSQVIGRIIEEKDGRLTLAVNPFDFTQTVAIEVGEVKERKRSPISPMPPGLINRLNADELKDLMAFLLGR